MATIRNVSGDDLAVALLGYQVVKDGDTFEVADDVFDNHSWSPTLYKVVAEPRSSKKKEG